MVVAEVRRALDELWMPDELRADAQLLVSELVTNSIRHAEMGETEMIRVRASWTGHVLRVDVYDRPSNKSGPTLAGTIRPLPGAESGWGLYLIDRIASRWGSMPGRFWFEVEFPRQSL
jgi:anti-sigma regulatory factor (Ser/Thr protein kinase)